MSSAQRKLSQPEAIEVACRRLADRQFGVISRAQAIMCGLSATSLSRRVTSGKWAKLYPRVYVVSGAADPWLRNLMGAILWGGEEAAVSHRSAAALWELDGATRGAPEISLQTPRRDPPSGLLVHVTRTLRGWDVRHVGPLRVTEPCRTLIDLAAVVTREELELALDAGLRKRLTSVARIEWRLDRVPSNGKPGVTVLRSLLEARREGPTPESPLETRFLRLVRQAGLSPPIAQFKVFHESEFVARVDFAYPNQKIAIELDGYGSHSSVAAFRKDRRRDNLLKQLGWTVLRYTDDDLHRPKALVEQLRLWTNRLL